MEHGLEPFSGSVGDDVESIGLGLWEGAARQVVHHQNDFGFGL